MNKEVKELINKEFKELPETFYEQVEIYKSMLIAYNEHTNVTAIHDHDEIDEKHFYDSFVLGKWMTGESKKVIDIGSGAGFPGLALSLLRPSDHVHLVESIAKKTRLLAAVKEKLALSQVVISTQRAEEYIRKEDLFKQFDYGVCRAVASLNIMVELVLPYLKIGGKLLAQKVNYQEELKVALPAIELLGGKVSHIDSYQLPLCGQERFVIVIEKIKETPLIYPRSSRIMSKKPL